MANSNYTEKKYGIIQLSGLGYKYISQNPVFDEDKEKFSYPSTLFYNEHNMRDFTEELKKIVKDLSDSELQKYLQSLFKINKRTNERVIYASQNKQPVFDYKTDTDKDFTAVIEVKYMSFTDKNTGKDIEVYSAKALKVKLTPESVLLKKELESAPQEENLLNDTEGEVVDIESEDLPF